MTKTAIISVDGHVKAPRAAYRDYLESKYHTEFDEWLRNEEAGGRPDAGNIHPDFAPEVQWDPDRRLRDMETQGVVAEVLFSNGIPFQVGRLSDYPDAPAELELAAAAAFNRWLADFCSAAPHRFRGQALISLRDVDRAVATVHWARDHGLGGIMMPALNPGDRYFFDPVLDPIWAAIEETGLPISQHGGVGAPTYGPPGLAAILTLAHEHSFFSGRSLWQMIVGGVFDRFPRLRVAYVETEAWWIGAALQQFDKRVDFGDDWTAFASFLQRARQFHRRPSEYWEVNCFAGISPFSPTQLPIDKIGSGYQPREGEFTIHSSKAMIGIDYPHFESIFPATADQVATLLAEPAMTETDAHRVLFGNAADLYGFDEHALGPDIERVGFQLGVPGTTE